MDALSDIALITFWLSDIDAREQPTFVHSDSPARPGPRYRLCLIATAARWSCHRSARRARTPRAYAPQVTGPAEWRLCWSVKAGAPGLTAVAPARVRKRARLTRPVGLLLVVRSERRRRPVPDAWIDAEAEPLAGRSDEPPFTGEHPHLFERKGEMPARHRSLWEARHVASLQLQHGTILNFDPRLTFEHEQHLGCGKRPVRRLVIGGRCEA